MAYKNPGTVRPLHRSSWPPQRREGPPTALQNADTASQRRTKGIAGTPSVLDDNRLWPQALQEMLESDGYQVAFVPRRERNQVEESQAEPSPLEIPPALLPFNWKALIARVYESVREFYVSSQWTVELFADVCVDFARMEVTRAGEPVR